MSDRARELQIRALLPLVKTIARRVHRMVPTADLDDLIGDGSVGLIRAVDGFDSTRGIPIDQYARRVVLGAILNGIRRLDPVAERTRRTMRIAEAARFALAHELGVLPTMAEMEREMPQLARARVETHQRTPLSLDAPLPNGERLEVDSGGDPQAVVSANAAREHVRDALASLPPRQRRVVLAHYFEERPLRSLVEPMRISPQRVSQLHLLAMQRLRAVLALHR